MSIDRSVFLMMLAGRIDIFLNDQKLANISINEAQQIVEVLKGLIAHLQGMEQDSEQELEYLKKVDYRNLEP